MAYNTAIYLFLFLPVVLIIYQLMPQKKRWIVLIMAGYVFFWSISGELLIYLIATTLFTHYIGVLLTLQKVRCREEAGNCDKKESIEIHNRYKKTEKCILILGIVVLLAVLVYLKFYNFFVMNINLIFQGNMLGLEMKNLLVPIGISFYTLQAIGYMADVYWEKIKADQPLGKLALFLGFFPQIMEGPISMYSQTADSLWEGRLIKNENLFQGCLRILWGLFKKMVIADRLNVIVLKVFNQYMDYDGAIILVVAIAYTIQLYMEFSGCMDIIIGSGKMFGVNLPENFRQPFFSKDAAEFWNRWHITLGAWFKKYIFYPVSVSNVVKRWNRFGRKHLTKYLTKLGITAICLFPVWLSNGLWHGARWTYIFYGMYYFVILLAGYAFEPLFNGFYRVSHIDKNCTVWKIVRILRTWVIIFTGELIFRADNLKSAFSMILSIFTNFNIQRLWDGTILELGLDRADYLAIIMACILVGIYEIIKERKMLDVQTNQTFIRILPVARLVVLYGLIFVIIFFGAYGTGYGQVDLIYAGF